MNDKWLSVIKKNQKINQTWNKAPFSESSLAKGFISRSPLSSALGDWAGFCNSRGPSSNGFFTADKDDINFDLLVLLTFSWSGRCKMVAPCVYIFDCIHAMFPWSIVSGEIEIESASIRKSNSICKGEERGDRERNPWLAKIPSSKGIQFFSYLNVQMKGTLFSNLR